MRIEVKRVDVLNFKYDSTHMENNMSMALNVQIRAPMKENAVSNMTVQYFVVLRSNNEDESPNEAAFESRIGIALEMEEPESIKEEKVQQELLKETYPYFVKKLRHIAEAVGMSELNLPETEEIISNSV